MTPAITPELRERAGKPVRLQLSRKKGFDLQAHSQAVNGLPAVNCARPSVYGNPWTVQQAAEIHDCRTESAHRHAVEWFREWITNPTTDDFSDSSGLGGHLRAHTRIREGLAGLRGKNLACFCRPGLDCHADVLLELANGPVCAPLDAPPASPLATGEAENPNQQTRLSASGARHHGGR